MEHVLYPVIPRYYPDDIRYGLIARDDGNECRHPEPLRFDQCHQDNSEGAPGVLRSLCYTRRSHKHICSHNAYVDAYIRRIQQ